MTTPINISDEARECADEVYQIYEVRTNYECTCFKEPECPCSFCNGWARAKKESTQRIQLLLNSRDAELQSLRRDKERLEWVMQGVARLPKYSPNDGAFVGFQILKDRDAIDAAMSGKEWK